MEDWRKDTIPEEHFVEREWEGSSFLEKENKKTRDYPVVYAGKFRWILGFILVFASFMFVAFAGYLFNIRSEYVLTISLAILTLVGVMVVDPHLPGKLFYPLRGKDWLIIIVGTIIAILFSFLAGNILIHFGMEGSQNPIVDVLVEGDLKKLFVVTWIQFIAEELVFALPFVFVYSKMVRFPKSFRVLCAVLVSSLIFGGMHLYTYNFNVVQSFLLIGLVRTGLTLSYLWSKNLTVTYIVHGLYDWILIGITVIALNQGMAL